MRRYVGVYWISILHPMSVPSLTYPMAKRKSADGGWHGDWSLTTGCVLWVSGAQERPA
jgi:hypothetical protein